MVVTFATTTTINGHDVSEADDRNYAVTVDGKLWGWVSGPTKGLRTRNGWIALKVGAECWGAWSPNRWAAVLAAL